MTFRAFTKACSVAWAILPDSLQTILEISTRENLPDFEAVEAARARRTDNGLRVRNGVAVINVTGPVFRYADFFTEISGATSVSALAKEFNAAIADPNITAILLNVDSPGGEVAGINEFAQMIFDARGKKPIVAYADGLAASAAYWIASAAEEIVTDATGLLGSIGVVAAVPNPDAKSAKDVQFVSSQSPNKRPNPNTESGKSQIQGMVDDLASVFIENIARNRAVTTDTVLSEFGGGGVMVGAKAVEAGLADRLGSFEQILSELAAGNWRKKDKRKMAAGTEAAEGENMTIQDIKTAVSETFASMGFKPKADEKLTAVDDSQIAAAEHARVKAEAEAKELREKLAAQETEKAKADAENFIVAQIEAGKLFPAEKDHALKMYLQAADSDAVAPLAEGSRVATFRALIEARPSHDLIIERTAGGELRRLKADENGQTELTEERRKQLLQMTPLGEAAALRLVK